MNRMSQTVMEQELIDKAISGSRAALDELLFNCYEQLEEHVTRTLSPQHHGIIEIDDIVQQTYIHAIRDIGQFTQNSNGSILPWLKKIAENRVKDAVRRITRERCTSHVATTTEHALLNEDSVADLVELLSAGSHTPSRSAVRHEAIAAVRQTIEALPDDYRQAVELRFLNGKSLQEIASIMNRSPRAVQGLVDRAKKKMRVALGRLSLYE